MKLKPGVDPKDVRGEILLAIWIAEGIWRDLGADLVITDLWRDPEAYPNSLHPPGLAVDLRTRNLPAGQATVAAERLREALGPNYDVVYYETHIHLEYDRKA